MQAFFRRFRSLGYFIVFLLVWHGVQAQNYVYAFTASGPELVEEVGPWQELQLSLNQLRALLTREESAEARVQAVTAHRDTLAALNEAVRRHLAEAGEALAEADLGEVNLQRHQGVVEAYERQSRQLFQALAAVERARGEAVAPALEALLALLPEPVSREFIPPLDAASLPHRAVSHQAAAPRLKGSEDFRRLLPDDGLQVASQGLDGLLAPQSVLPAPLPEDLEETIDVVFTDQLTQLAADLDHDPVLIYEYVRNNFDFEATWGSIKGAQGTLWSEGGNAFDQASLLIALLRISGIPARYQTGTVEIPVDQVMSWTGTFDPQAASSLLSSGGIPATGIIVNGELDRVRLEHVWVQAWVDYTPSRGAVNEDGDHWIALDPSFKLYETTPSIDFANQLSLDGQSLWNQVQASAQTGSYSATGFNPALLTGEIDAAKGRLEDYLDANPVETLGELTGIKRVIRKAYGLLPASRQYQVTALLDNYAAIPSAERHGLTVRLADVDDFGFEDTVFNYTTTLPAVAGRRITLSYAPADQATINYLTALLPTGAGSTEAQLQALPGSLSASQVRLIPQLMIDGSVVATGSTVGMGYDQNINITLTSPGGFSNGNVSNTIVAGTYQALVLNLGLLSGDYLTQRQEAVQALQAQLQAGNADGIDKDDVFGEALYLAGIKYWQQVNFLNRVAGRMTGVHATRLPSEGLFSHDLGVVYGGLVFPVPQTITSAGMGTDIDHDLQAVVSQDGDEQRSKNYMLLTGSIGSYMEASVWDQLLNDLEDMSFTGVSTTHVLAYANANNIPIFHINSSNVAAVLPQLQVSQEVRSAVSSAVASGQVVTIPQREVTIDGWWTGTGYAVTDPTTGAGAYLISGGTAGGGFELPPLHPLLLFLIGGVLTFLGIFAGLGTGIALAIAAILVTIYDLLSSVSQVLDDPNLTAQEKDMIIGMLSAFAVIGVILAVAGIFLGGIAGFVAAALLFSVLSIIASNLILSLGPALARRRNNMGGMLWPVVDEQVLLALGLGRRPPAISPGGAALVI